MALPQFIEKYLPRWNVKAAHVDRAGMFGEVGHTGTKLFNGKVFEEYNTSLSGGKKWDAFEKMRAHSQVAAVRRVYEMPMMVSDWSVQPASDIETDGRPDSSDDAKAIADFCTELLWDMPEDDWMGIIRQAAGAIFNGVMVFELVYYLREDKRIGIVKLGPRLPRSFNRWATDDHGGFTGIVQDLPDDSTRVVDSQITEDGGIFIPAEKLIVLTHEQDGSNFEGRGLARDMWADWWYADSYAKLMAMASERTGMGVPIATIPNNLAPADRTALVNLVKRFRANEEAGIVVPNDVAFNITDIKEPMQIRPMIVHHIGMMARAGLANFLTLGDKGTGSFAMSKDQSDFFTMSLESKMEWIRGVLQRRLVRPLVVLNFGADAPMPELRYQLARQNIVDRIDVMTKAIATDLMIPDEPVRAIVREALDLPHETNDTPTRVKSDKDKDGDEVENASPRLEGRVRLADIAVGHNPTADGSGFSRAATARETEYRLSEVSDQWDEYERRLQAEVGASLDEAVEGMLRRIRANILRAANRTSDVTRIFGVDIPTQARARVTRQFQAIGDEAMDWARAFVAERAGIEAADISSSTRRFMRSTWNENVERMMRDLRDRLLTKIRHDKALIAELETGNVGEGTLNRVVQEARALYTGSETAKSFQEVQLKAWSQVTVGDAVRSGWDTTLTKNDRVVKIQRSELLDTRTCDNCRKLDGLVFTKEDWPRISPPGKCFGGSLCRGIGIGILVEETPQPATTSIDGIPSMKTTRLTREAGG